MKELIKTGVLYFAFVFTVAFAIGILRTVFVAPVVGALAAVLIELPIVIAASWAAARLLLKQMPFVAVRRAVIGATAFILLMVTECALAALLFDRTPTKWANDLMTPPGLLGLGGQIVFAIMPLIVRRSAAQLYAQKSG
jgi:hypothetical protein